VKPVSQNASIDALTDGFVTGSDLLRKAFQIGDPAAQLVHSEDGFRLVKAFLRIESAERRQAVLKHATEMARIDEAERTR
jgi:hypothetical protein